MRCILWLLALYMRYVKRFRIYFKSNIRAPPALGRQRLTKFVLLCKGLFGFQVADNP